jgi:hypothetical protein
MRQGFAGCIEPSHHYSIRFLITAQLGVAMIYFSIIDAPGGPEPYLTHTRLGVAVGTECRKFDTTWSIIEFPIQQNSLLLLLYANSLSNK